MILPPGTVFVLGAGASVPFGLPPGVELKRKIAHVLQKPNHPFNLIARDLVGLRRPEDLAEIGRSIDKAGVPSVDEWARSNPRYAQLVKTVLAAVLLEREAGKDVLPGRPEFRPDHD